MLQAMAFYAQEERIGALTALQQALTLAEPEGFVRLFVDEGNVMRELLKEVIDQPGTVNTHYVHRLLAASSDSPTPVRDSQASAVKPGALIESLSEREFELLRLIAVGKTNRAIADELMVSVNTVKTHARNIYGKLGVRNRTEATSRARDLGLI